MISIRRAAPVLAVSVVALAAGCAGKDSGTSSAPPTDGASPTATLAGTPTVTPTPIVSTPASPRVAKGGCPVGATTLEKAFKANPDLANAIVLGTGFSDITCYMDFATARANPANMDRAMVLFAYDSGSGTWKALTGGTDLDCRQAPATVISHLPGCHRE
jgi:hypothetical protein